MSNDPTPSVYRQLTSDHDFVRLNQKFTPTPLTPEQMAQGMRGSKPALFTQNLVAQGYLPKDFYWNPAWDPLICTTQVTPEKDEDQAMREMIRELSQLMRDRQVVLLNPRKAARRTVIDEHADMLFPIVSTHVDGEMVVRIIKKRNALEPSKYIVMDSWSDFSLG